MNLQSLEGKKFLSFDHFYLDFNTIQGLAMIEGWNWDDNSASGAGKTGMLDILSFNWFGEVHRKIPVTEFINDFATSGCETTTRTMMDDGQILTIFRSRKPEDLWYQIGDGKKERGDNLRKTQKMLEDLLKLDFNTFINSVYFTNNADSNFISANDETKRDILTRILDLSDFDKAYTSADLKIKSQSKRRDSLEHEINSASDKVSSISQDIIDLITQSENFESDKKREIAAKEQAIQKLQFEIYDVNDESVKLRNTKFDIIDIKTIIPPDFGPYDAERDKLWNTKFESIHPLDVSDLDARKAKLIADLAIKPKLQEKIKQLEANDVMIKTNWENLNDKIRKINTQITSECPTCFQQVSAEHLIGVRDQTLEAINVLYNSRNENMAVLKKFRGYWENVEKREQELRDIESEYRTIERSHASETQRIEQEKGRIKDRIVYIEKQKQLLMTAHENKLREIEYQNSLIEQSKLKIANEIIAKDKLAETLIRSIQSLDADIDTIRSRENHLLRTIEQKMKAETEAMNQLKNLRADDETLAKDLEALEILKMSYKNVKYYIFESTIDELNRRLTKYMEPLFNEDIKIEYKYISGKDSDKLKFATEITKNGKIKSFESLSEGEKVRGKLATNFGLADIVAMRKSNSLSLMLLDEVFNGLPEECRERVVDLLELLKNEKETILIIDHFKAMANLIEKTIRIERKDGISALVS